MLSHRLILCHPLLLLTLIFPSIRVFSNVLALCIKWPKHWSLEDRNSDRTKKHCRVSAYFWDPDALTGVGSASFVPVIIPGGEDLSSRAHPGDAAFLVLCCLLFLSSSVSVLASLSSSAAKNALLILLYIF